MSTKKIACIIPARLNSSRFPKKILASLAGKPLLQHTWEAAIKTNFFSDVAIAIDAQETENTDRLIEAIHKEKLNADIFVNWQADDPFISLQMLQNLFQSYVNDSADVWTLKKQIFSQNEILSPHVVKVVCDINDYALYFSRSPIPYHCNPSRQRVALPHDEQNVEAKKTYFKHIGIYAFTTNALQKIGKLEQCYTEKAENLEQLRFLHNQMKIKVHTTNQEVLGVNTPEDLKRAEKYIKQNFINL